MLSGVAVLAAAEPDATPFPEVGSKKGLQVQLNEDAIALGVKHATFNVSLGALMAVAGGEGTLPFVFQDREFHFRRGALAQLDRNVKALHDTGAVVYLILLAYRTGDAATDAVLAHPGARTDRSYPVAAFDSVTPDGRAWLRATAALLASRYSGEAAATHGRVWGYIVGNEANSHFMWYHRGPAPFAAVVDDYEQAFRLVHEGVRAYSTHARLYVSLDHFWTAKMPNASAEEAGPGREFLDRFAAFVRERGDHDWHLAYHPYPENLFNPRTWEDRSVTPDETSARITFKNLEVLTRYLEQPVLQWQGRPRRIILSEQGFHTTEGADGLTDQAAAYAYAWEKTARLPGIDAFIYHRHVDHRDEGGLRLGLWERRPDSVATPLREKPIHALFRVAGTPAWEDAARPYLPVTKLPDWDALAPAR